MTAEYRGSHSLALVEMKLAWRKYTLCSIFVSFTGGCTHFSVLNINYP